MGVAVFAADNTIRRWVDRDGSMPHWSEFDKGGHITTMEAPNETCRMCGRFSVSLTRNATYQYRLFSASQRVPADIGLSQSARIFNR
ncbi:hypothetical protein [Spirosoma endbachense]|uniref:Uncharacterized protein n=1 Tax=Spirosoma endbachense TaxID=2666025 RepID=A0A6P1W9B7_9BACT|nr:hypothetical protein [Spirosoma endbachense]QHW00297.1 hypothetical protein GJR95_37070 [Spirosoma endbachense]